MQVNGRTFATAMAPDIPAALLRGGRATINIGLN